jgi:hypothetical protein
MTMPSTAARRLLRSAHRHEVNRTIEDIEKDAALREKLAPPTKVEPGLVQP